MLLVENVVRAFDGVPVLRGVKLEIERGEIVCLLGPSGCGKTTLLRIIAGLERLDAGDVRLDGESILGVPVHQRDFGLMFQDFALFPHLNVAQNVLFGLRMRHAPPAQQDRRLGEVLELVGLAGFERRDVTSLSGGEKQRVALARSLAPNPRLLLLDEPLGSLDAALRERLVVELRAIIKQVGLTALYVTHDQSEAYAIADQVAIMNAGVIEQVGTPEAVYRRPATMFVARFLGLNNIVPIARRDGNCALTPVGAFRVDESAEALLLHPDGLTLVAADTPESIAGRVIERTFSGGAYRVEMAHAGGITLAFRLAANDRVPQVGETIALHVASEWVVGLNGNKR